MSWRSKTIGEICSLITSGGTPTSTNESYYYPPEIPWLKTGEVNYSRIYNTEKHISREGLANSSAKLIPANSVIIAMYGQGNTAGRVAINKVPITTNQACCNLVINSEIANYEFVYYTLCTMYDKIVSLKNGGAQPNLNAKTIKSLKIRLPNLPTQRYIASILSTYDDLIENNQKQIKLLEEAAQRLYKEWFVDLRFPGWENTKIVDGVPEGWKIKLLHTIADINRQLLLKNNTYTCMNYIDISSVQMGAILKKTEYNKNNLPNRAKRIAKHGDVIWGMVRPNLKSYALVLSPNANDVFSTGFSILSATKVPFSYLYYTVIQDSFVKYLVNCTNGSTYPAVKPLDFAQAKILLPTADLLTSFHSITEPLLRKKEVISKQIKLLEKGRNVLIHKFFDYEMEENI